MVGIVFRREFPMEALRDLREVARTGLIPGETMPGHRDGWGIVSFRNGAPWYVGRSTRPMFNDESFDAASKYVQRIQAPNILIAHARARSSGTAAIPDTHPFVLGDLVLGHNGTVYNIGFKPRHATKGNTDSELLLARLSDRVEDSGDLASSIRSLVIDDVHSHEYSAAIMLISDGKKLYAYRDFSPGKSADYYDLKMAVREDCVAFYQETRMEYDGVVSQIEDGELVTVDLDLNIQRAKLG